MVSLMNVKIDSVRTDNGGVVFRAAELGEMDVYISPKFHSTCIVAAGAKLQIWFHRPTDLITQNPLPFFVADEIQLAST